MIYYLFWTICCSKRYRRNEFNFKHNTSHESHEGHVKPPNCTITSHKSHPQSINSSIQFNSIHVSPTKINPSIHPLPSFSSINLTIPSWGPKIPIHYTHTHTHTSTSTSSRRGAASKHNAQHASPCHATVPLYVCYRRLNIRTTPPLQHTNNVPHQALTYPSSWSWGSLGGIKNIVHATRLNQTTQRNLS